MKPQTFSIPSRSFKGNHTVTFNGKTWRCSCAGYHRWHSKPGFACHHIRAAQDRISSRLLLVTGEPTEEMIDYAIGDLSSIFLLRTHYHCNGNRTIRYGFSPRYGGAVSGSVGLTSTARRVLSPAEVSACVATLKRMREALVDRVAA